MSKSLVKEEVSAKVHIYLEIKENETKEEAKSRLTNFINKIQNEDGISVQIHEID